VRESIEAARAAARPGISGEQLYGAAAAVIEDGGFPNGGVRFEDLLLIAQDGCDTLTRYPYDL
jgi:Xaa-Pro aminopeptidase